jgi:hypothetical protein
MDGNRRHGRSVLTVLSASTASSQTAVQGETDSDDHDSIDAIPAVEAGRSCGLFDFGTFNGDYLSWKYT